MGSFGLPTILDLVRLVERQELLLGLFLAGGGLIFIILGIRIFNVLVAISFGVVGFVLGMSLPVSEWTQWVCAFLAAAGLAVASTFVMKLSVAVLAGGWSGCVVLGLATRFGAGEPVALIMGGLALAMTIALAFVMYEQIIALVTSIEGSFLFLGGLVVFFSHSPYMWHHFRPMLTDNPIFAPFLLLAGTVTGFYLQLTEIRQQKSGVSG